jgi:cob(I)alamin adenosyltransferase
MLSITKTSTVLRISKFRLLKLLESENIVPQKSGNKKLLSEDQIQHLRNVIESQREQTDLFQSSVVEEMKKSSTSIDLSVHQEIVKELKNQIVYLQQQLEGEKRERAELSKGILAVQSQMFKVQQALEVKSTKKESFIQRMFSFS